MALTASFARRALVVSAAAAAALVALAIPASAHIPKADTSCDQKTGTVTLHVDLTKYNTESKNTVKITEGDKVILDTTSFGAAFVKDFPGFAGDVEHTFVVDIHVTDDQKFTQKLTVGPTKLCKKKEPPTSTTTTTTTTTTTSATTTTTTAANATTTTSAAAVVASTALADTGASIGLPLAIGALLLIGGVGMLILVRRRRKA